MNELITHGQWRLWFCMALGVAILCSLIMQWLEYRLWRLKAEGPMKISVLNLEFPSTPEDLPRMLTGILRMDQWLEKQHLPARSAAALRKIEYVDYFFMPAAYGAIFLLALAIAHKFGLQTPGGIFFLSLACAQGIAWICDLFENTVTLIYLSKVKRALQIEQAEKQHTRQPTALYIEGEMVQKEKLKKQVPSLMPKPLFRLFTTAVWIKWVLALLGLSTSLMLVFYFWLKGSYNASTLLYLGIAAAEILLFVVVGQWIKQHAENTFKISSPSLHPQA